MERASTGLWDLGFGPLNGNRNNTRTLCMGVHVWGIRVWGGTCVGDTCAWGVRVWGVCVWVRACVEEGSS